jgi:predicted PurR-regulated permease PerM
MISNLRQIFALFIYTIAIVYLLRPLVDFFEGRGMPRLLAVIVTYLIVMLLIALLLLYLIPIIVNQGTQFIKRFPGYLKAEIEFVELWKGKLIELRVPPSAVKLLEQSVEKLREAGLALLSSIPGFTLNIFSIVFFFILAPFLAFYLLKDFEQVKETIIDLIPDRYKDDSLDILHKVDLVLSGFLRGQVLVALSVGTLASIIFTILGVDFSIVLGMIVGILNVVPYFGPIMGGLIAAMVAFFKAPILAVWVILAMVAVQMIDATLLSPNIMSQQVNLHPVLIAFSLLIGGSLLGVLGIVIAIPSAAVGKAIVYHFLECSRRIESPSASQGTPPLGPNYYP